MEYSTVKTMKSVLTSQTTICYCPDCGRPATDCHHIYEGKNKTLSEKFKLMIPLCHEHHMALHNDQEMNNYFKRRGQIAWEEFIGTRAEFIEIIGKNYL